MVILQGLCGMSNICDRLPGTFIWRVANPINKVFEALVLDPGV
jgi:hypothetical protein